eukprot:g2628.t1
MSVLSDDDLQALYAWVDEVPLSRPKRNIARDFSDGVLVAEMVAHYFPRLVELHNYSSANSAQQKAYNWATLNQKVFRKLGFHVEHAVVQDIVGAKLGAIEGVLVQLRTKMAQYQTRRAAKGTARSARGAHAVHQQKLHPSHTSAQTDNAAAAAAAASGARAAAAVEAGAMGAVGAPPPPPIEPPPVHTQAQLNAGQLQAAVDAEMLVEKEQTIQELRETNEILEFKVQKLEQLIRLKDAKIQSLTAAVAAAEAGQRT